MIWESCDRDILAVAHIFTHFSSIIISRIFFDFGNSRSIKLLASKFPSYEWNRIGNTKNALEFYMNIFVASLIGSIVVSTHCSIKLSWCCLSSDLKTACERRLGEELLEVVHDWKIKLHRYFMNTVLLHCFFNPIEGRFIGLRKWSLIKLPLNGRLDIWSIGYLILEDLLIIDSRYLTERNRILSINYSSYAHTLSR